MPRRHRRLAVPTDLDEGRARQGTAGTWQWSDGAWTVRHISASAATKVYRCPGCDHEIRSGIAHVVAWPADDRGDLSDRRHWHSGCWRARERRGPTRRSPAQRRAPH